jgi:hypothetical protein
VTRSRWKALGLAAGLAAALGLGQPALASMERGANTQTTTLAGLDFNNYIGVPGAVSAIVVVPKLNCAGTTSAGSAIEVGVGIASVNSYARLTLACSAQGAARYSPSLVVAGTVKNIGGDAARAGDRVEFAVSQSDTQVTVSVIDLTHKFIATSNGGGGGTSEGISAGAYPAASGSTTSAVPNFGIVTFSSALVNGYPLGLSGTGLQTDDLATGSTLQVETTTSAATPESFTTVFKHS